MKAYAIILAAGRGERFGSDKVLEDLGGKPVWRWSFETFAAHPGIDAVGIVASEGNLRSVQAANPAAAFVVVGGASRPESVRRGLAALDCKDGDVVLLHDAARPLVSHKVIDRVLAGAQAKGAAAAAIAPADTIRELQTAEVIDRNKVVLMQTPQAARLDMLRGAYADINQSFTDDVAYLEAAGTKVQLVTGEPANFKITTVEDLATARSLVGHAETRTGLGYDVHAFSTDLARPLVLGGVLFPEGPGLDGHSDADVIIHAAVDALLGAAALGDIGQHFPPSDQRWKNEPSTTFLKHAALLLMDSGWRVVNLDIAVIAERPKIMGRAVDMRQAMAAVLGVDANRVSVKATTNEGLGSIGRGEGIAAFATATIAR